MDWLDADAPASGAGTAAPVRQFVPGQQPFAPVHPSAPQYPGSAPIPALSYEIPGYGDPYAWGQTRKKALGVASFIIGCVADVVLIGMVIVAGVASESARAKSAPGAGTPGLVIFAGCGLILAVGANFIGLILGLVSVFQRQRRNLWGIFGLILNGGALLLLAGLMLLGMAVG